MARHSVAGRATVVGTTVRGMASVFSTATVGAIIRQIAIFNTTSTGVAYAVVRMTNATGVGAGLTEANYDPSSPAICTGFAGHTADGAVGEVIEQGSLGAAVGSGVVLTFGESGLRVTVGTANGIAITCPTGTGQICDYTITWDELGDCRWL